MAEPVEQLFHEFAMAHARGQTPDPRPCLERAGEEAPVLRRMLDAYLRTAPGQPPSRETRELVVRWLREVSMPPNGDD